MASFIEEMIENTWSRGSKREGTKKEDRKWGFTIYRTYYSEESDEAWQMLLYSLRHQTKLAFGAFAKGADVEHDVDPDDVQRLKDLFYLETRDDRSQLEGLDVRDLREFCRDELSKDKEIIEKLDKRSSKFTRPRETQGMADWVFEYVLLADEAVLKDVARDEPVVKAVSIQWMDGDPNSTWGWMRIPTGYLLELWHHLLFNDRQTSRALHFDGAEEELKTLIWAGDMACNMTGLYSEIRDGPHPYDNQSLRCLSLWKDCRIPILAVRSYDDPRTWPIQVERVINKNILIRFFALSAFGMLKSGVDSRFGPIPMVFWDRMSEVDLTLEPGVLDLPGSEGGSFQLPWIMDRAFECLGSEINDKAFVLVEKAISDAKNKSFHKEGNRTVGASSLRGYLERKKGMSDKDIQKSGKIAVNRIRDGFIAFIYINRCRSEFSKTMKDIYLNFKFAENVYNERYKNKPDSEKVQLADFMSKKFK
ncbi:hypothetical protein FVEN_g8173 [Fusarium venenatum]|nr:hypothetical protein FVEN_g8173 [Fusarium venenatum]